MIPVIETENLSKSYGRVQALVDVSLQVEAGEICGFLGPNGSGKSTFVKIVLDLVRSERGSARLFGCDTRRPAARKHTGFLPENIKAYTFLCADEFVGLHARLAGCRGTQAVRREVQRCLELVGMQAHAGRRIDTLSKGMLQRVGIAQALAGNARLLIMDEPTSGLDPIGIADLRRLLLQLKAQGVTVFLNSHLLSEVERTCDRVAILHRGRIVRSGTHAELSGVRSGLELCIHNYTDAIGRAVAALCEKPLEPCDPGSGRFLAVPRPGPDATLRIHQAVCDNGGRLDSFAWKRDSLEDLFYRLIQDADTDTGAYKLP